MFGYVRVYARACPSMPGYAQVCAGKPEYARECVLGRTRAHSSVLGPILGGTRAYARVLEVPSPMQWSIMLGTPLEINTQSRYGSSQV